MHPGGRYVGRVDTNADLHTVLEYAMCRAFLGSRCNTAAEPSFTPIHTDKVGKSTRHGITPTVRSGLCFGCRTTTVLGYAIAGLFSGQGATPWPSHLFTLFWHYYLHLDVTCGDQGLEVGDRGPQTRGRRLIAPYGTLSLSNPDETAVGVK